MNLIGLCVTRDDGWILGFTARVALRWVDHLIVMEHCPTASTVAAVDGLMSEFGPRITRLSEDRPAWDESIYRQRLLDAGRARGGTHFGSIDGDEALSANLLPMIRGMVEALRPTECLRLPWPCLWRDLRRYRVDDSPFGRAYVPVAFCDDPSLSHNRPEYPIHTRIPIGANLVNKLNVGDGGAMHCQHVEWRRLVQKQNLYRLVETLRFGRTPAEINGTYDASTDETGLVTAPTPAEWWAGYEDLLPHIHLGETPWQEAECERLIAEHGRDKFVGLNLA